MSLSRLRSIVFISTLYLWGAPAFAQPPAQVVGRVVAEETGQPVPDARVGLEGTPHTAVAGADGGFAFSRVAPGRYTLVVERDGFQTVRAGIEVTPGAGHPIDVRLPFALTVQEDVTVVGRTVGDLGLGGEASTASRLPLRPIDIPASVDILDSTVMDARGYQKVSDAVGRMAGVVSGEHPTAPSSFSMRGFTTSQVATLRDGIWLGPSPMVMRPQNTFNLERIELMRGPLVGRQRPGVSGGRHQRGDQDRRAHCRNARERTPLVRPLQYLAHGGRRDGPDERLGLVPAGRQPQRLGRLRSRHGFLLAQPHWQRAVAAGVPTSRQGQRRLFERRARQVLRDAPRARGCRGGAARRAADHDRRSGRRPDALRQLQRQRWRRRSAADARPRGRRLGPDGRADAAQRGLRVRRRPPVEERRGLRLLRDDRGRLPGTGHRAALLRVLHHQPRPAPLRRSSDADAQPPAGRAGARRRRGRRGVSARLRARARLPPPGAPRAR